MIGVGVHTNAKDLAVLSQRQLTPQIDVTTESGRDQIAGLVLDPLHGTFEEDRRQNRYHIPGIDRDLVAEATTEVG